MHNILVAYNYNMLNKWFVLLATVTVAVQKI